MHNLYSPKQFLLPKQFRPVVGYREFLPAAELAAKGVYCYWELWSKTRLDKPFTYHILPDACLDIVFDRLQGTYFFAGTQFRVQEVTIGQEFNYCGVRFFPACLQRFVALEPAAILSTDFLLCEEPLAAQLLAGLQQQNDWVAVFNQLLNEHPLGAENSEALALLAVFYRDDFKIADAEAVFGLSARQLHRKIKAATGLSPKELQKIIRFQHYLATVDEQLLDCGYYDQSHLIKDFQLATGYTPSQYFQ